MMGISYIGTFECNINMHLVMSILIFIHTFVRMHIQKQNVISWLFIGI